MSTYSITKPAFGRESQHAPALPAGNKKILEFGDRPLLVQDVLGAAKGEFELKLSSAAQVAIQRSRAHLAAKLLAGEPIYGVTTGFGGNAKYQIPTQDQTEHQRNLLEFLSVGTGPYLSDTAVRAAMVLRANALAQGWSAVRLVVVVSLVQFLNHEITPLVHRFGSVGASGDLVPSAAVARALCGLGDVRFQGYVMPAAEALKHAGLQPLQLEAKEGLALVNGTTTMTAVAMLAADEAKYLFEVALTGIAMAVEALEASPDYYDDRIHVAKHHPGPIAVAACLRAALSGSERITVLDEIKTKIADAANRAHAGQKAERAEHSIQAPYSLRCVPQGLGPFAESLADTWHTLEREGNSPNDNPLVCPQTGDVLHTGNFYGASVARVMDGLKLGLCNLANWLHAILALLMDPRFSGGLPDCLSPHPGVSQGFKGLQIAHTSLVTAIRHLAAPSLIHTLPTESFNQDVVSLGTHAAMIAQDITKLLRDVV